MSHITFSIAGFSLPYASATAVQLLFDDLNVPPADEGEIPVETVSLWAREILVREDTPEKVEDLALELQFACARARRMGNSTIRWHKHADE